LVALGRRAVRRFCLRLQDVYEHLPPVHRPRLIKLARTIMRPANCIAPNGMVVGRQHRMLFVIAAPY
jgi:hypothetical protein